MGSSNLYLDPIVVPMVSGSRILDVACGFGRWGCLLTTNAWESRYLSGKPLEIVGLDGHSDNVRLARRFNVYSEVIEGLIPPLPFPDGAFDTVLLIEIIEHLHKDDGMYLISEAKRVASERVILSTPNYPAYRDGHETMTGYNDLEAHRSYWSRHDLSGLGFRLYGAGWAKGGPRFQKVLHRIRLKKWYDSVLCSNLSSLSRSFPVFGDSTVAVWSRG